MIPEPDLLGNLFSSELPPAAAGTFENLDQFSCRLD